MMRPIKIYDLGNFQIYHIAPLTIISMLKNYIPMTYLFYNWKPVAVEHLFSFLLPPTSDNQFLLSISVSSNFFLFWFLDSIYKCDHTVFVFFCPTSISIKPWSSICGVTNVDFLLFLFLSNILCVCVQVCVCTHTHLHAHTHTHTHTHTHNFFIHLSIDGYLGCFPVLAIINNAVMWV